MNSEVEEPCCIFEEKRSKQESTVHLGVYSETRPMQDDIIHGGRIAE